MKKLLLLSALLFLACGVNNDKNNEDIRFLVMAEKMIETEPMKGYSGYRYDKHFSTKTF